MGKYISTITHKVFNIKDVVRIVNPKQSAFYWHNGVAPIDIYVSEDYITNEPVIVYIFLKSQTYDVYSKWQLRKE